VSVGASGAAYGDSSAGPFRRWRGVAATLTAVLALGFAVPAVASAESSDQAVAYQIDAAHDGFQSGDSLTAPLSQIWSLSFPGPVSYPLIVNGVVYVTAAVGTNYATSGYGTTLYAIDQATGMTLWSRALGGTYWWSGLTYENGRVFTLTFNGMLTAFDAATGATDWAISLPGQYAFSSAPTAFDGYVYADGAGSGGTLYAVSEETGSVAWTAPVANGDDSSPAVSASGVYVTYAGPQDYAFSPLTGALLWHYGSDLEGGGGATPVLADGYIFTRDNGDNPILSTSTGVAVGSINSGVAPAVGGGDAYSVSGGTLTAVGQSGLGTNAWTFSGDSQLDTAPLVVGNLVFEGSASGNVYAVDSSTGTSVWSANAGSDVSAPNEDGGMLSGLGAGEGTLIVPAGSTLVAYAGANVGTGTPTSTSPPTVTGTPDVGMQIAADVGAWTALPASYTYQWFRCDATGGLCADIPGATAATYTPVTADGGSTLEVSIAATNAAGTSSTLTSAPSNVVIGPPTNVATPTIDGSAAQDVSLSASPGSWTGSPTSYRYKWLRCTSGSCVPETGATSSTYVVAPTDVGSQIEVEVTAVNALGSSASAVSGPSAAIPVIGTTTMLAASENPAPTGTVVTLTATVSPSVDGGTVSFSQAGTPIVGCTALLVGGRTGGVTCADTFPQGADAISAAYSGDSAHGASSAGLTLVINPIATDPIATAAAPAPVAVTITGKPRTTSPAATITYAETGPVSSTTCTIDAQAMPCDDSEAILSGLHTGQHTFVVAVTGPDSQASANVTWTITPIASAAAAPKAPRDLRVHTTQHSSELTWTPSPGASAYRLTITIAKHTHVYMLSASRHSYTSTLRRRQPAVIHLRAVSTNGTTSAAATVTVR
jgi:outer membrane protein assembly factor BamB